MVEEIVVAAVPPDTTDRPPAPMVTAPVETLNAVELLFWMREVTFPPTPPRILFVVVALPVLVTVPALFSNP